MERQQRVLDCILDRTVGAEAAAGDASGERQDRFEEGAIGGAVPLLRRGQQCFPIRASVAVQFDLPGRWCNLIAPGAEIAVASER